MKRWSLLLVLVFAMSLFLAACSGDEKGDSKEKEDASKTENTDAGKSEAKGEDKPAPEQKLSVNIKSEPPSLHPGLAADSTSGAVLNQTFEGLMRVNQKGVVEEAMAESADMSEDGLTYTFKIRQDAKWSNGDPVTAQDFEYAWKWVLDPANAEADYAYQLYMIKGAEDSQRKRRFSGRCSY